MDRAAPEPLERRGGSTVQGRDAPRPVADGAPVRARAACGAQLVAPLGRDTVARLQRQGGNAAVAAFLARSAAPGRVVVQREISFKIGSTTYTAGAPQAIRLKDLEKAPSSPPAAGGSSAPVTMPPVATPSVATPRAAPGAKTKRRRKRAAGAPKAASPSGPTPVTTFAPAASTGSAPAPAWGFVATVPAGIGKDANEIAKLHERGFPSPEEAARAFRLVAGLNWFVGMPPETDLRNYGKPPTAPTGPAGSAPVASATAPVPLTSLVPNQARLDAELGAAMEERPFTWGKLVYLWDVTWKATRGSTETTLDRQDFVKSLFASLAQAGDEAARDRALARIAAAGGQLVSHVGLPYGFFRSILVNHALTKRYVEDLARGGIPRSNVYLHVADPDAPDLTPPSSGTTPPLPTALYDRYGALLTKRTRERAGEPSGPKTQAKYGRTKKLAPDVMTGGYVLQAAGGADRYTAYVSRLDMGVRQALSRIYPMLAYYPEPNTLLRYEAIEAVKAPGPLFGTGKHEMPSAMEAILGKGLKKDVPAGEQRFAFKERATFKPEAAVPTGTGGRGARFKPDPVDLAAVYDEFLKPPAAGATPGSTVVAKPTAALGGDIPIAIASVLAVFRAHEAEFDDIVVALLKGSPWGKTMEEMAELAKIEAGITARTKALGGRPRKAAAAGAAPTALSAQATKEQAGLPADARPGDIPAPLMELARQEAYFKVLTTPEQGHHKPATLVGILAALDPAVTDKAAIQGELVRQAGTGALGAALKRAMGGGGGAATPTTPPTPVTTGAASVPTGTPTTPPTATPGTSGASSAASGATKLSWAAVAGGKK